MVKLKKLVLLNVTYTFTKIYLGVDGVCVVVVVCVCVGGGGGGLYYKLSVMCDA